MFIPGPYKYSFPHDLVEIPRMKKLEKMDRTAVTIPAKAKKMSKTV